MNEFVEYVYDFYGPDGIYKDFFNPSPDREEIAKAAKIVEANNNFCGDSFDRELTRDVMFAQRGQTENLEYPKVLEWVK